MNTQNLIKNLYLSLLNVDECLVHNWNFQKVNSPFTRLYLIKSGEGNIIVIKKIYFKTRSLVPDTQLYTL